MKLFGGLDIGTNGVRLVVVDKNFKIYFEEAVNYKTMSPKEGWAEQDPQEIYTSCLKLFDRLVSEFPADELYITFSSVMHSLIGVDQVGNNLTPLIIWADTRSREKRDILQQEYGKESFYQHTACPLHSTYWPAKILWMKETFEQKIARFISIKEYIIFQLTGEWKTDYSLASTAGIFNLEKREYDQEILAISGIEPDQLSPVYSPTESFQFKINGKVLTGFMGATDGVLANLGAGAIESNMSVLTVGSSSAVRFISKVPVLDPAGRAWCYMLDEDFYVIGEATNGAGIILKWLVDIFAYQGVKELIEDNIPSLPYQGNEIICIPTLMAERGPNYNERLRGLFYGLSLNHSRSDIVTTVYESIALFLKMIYEDVKRVNGKEPKSITMTGTMGLTRKFMGLVYHLIGEVNYLPGHDQNTAIGAAMMGIKEVTGTHYSQLIKNLPEYRVMDFELDDRFSNYLAEKYNRFIDVYNRISLD